MKDLLKFSSTAKALLLAGCLSTVIIFIAQCAQVSTLYASGKYMGVDAYGFGSMTPCEYTVNDVNYRISKINDLYDKDGTHYYKVRFISSEAGINDLECIIPTTYSDVIYEDACFVADVTFTYLKERYDTYLALNRAEFDSTEDAARELSLEYSKYLTGIDFLFTDYIVDGVTDKEKALADFSEYFYKK